MASYRLVVLSNATADREDEYNDWYTNQHIGDALAVPGFVAAQRFKVHSKITNPEIKTTHKYMTIYEIETDKLDKTLSELQRRHGAAEMPISDAIDIAGVSTSWYEVMTPRIVKKA